VDALEGVGDGVVELIQVAVDPGDSLGVAVVVEFDLVESDQVLDGLLGLVDGQEAGETLVGGGG
jgi:hypothetical protein